MHKSKHKKAGSSEGSHSRRHRSRAEHRESTSRSGLSAPPESLEEEQLDTAPDYDIEEEEEEDYRPEADTNYTSTRELDTSANTQGMVESSPRYWQPSSHTYSLPYRVQGAENTFDIDRQPPSLSENRIIYSAPSYDYSSTANSTSTFRSTQVPPTSSSYRTDQRTSGTEAYGYQNERSGTQNNQSDTQDDRSGTQAQRPPTSPPIPASTRSQSQPYQCQCESDRHNLCGVVIGPKPPKPRDGKIKKEKKSSSSRSGKSASSKKDSAKSKTPSRSKPGRADVEGSSGSNCGPIILPGITPWPKPHRGEDDYEINIDQWRRHRESWKDITCPCLYGYFDDDGLWISGGDVRADREPGNPRWESTGFRNPRVTSDSAERPIVTLYERDYEENEAVETEASRIHEGGYEEEYQDEYAGEGEYGYDGESGREDDED